jgi:hypothetical protein
MKKSAALVGDFTPWYKNGINIGDKFIGYTMWGPQDS